MTVRLTNQLQRLSYTRKDIDLIDQEVQMFIQHFIPVIKNTTGANVGTKFRQLLEALIDKLHYSQDMRFRQSTYRNVTELQAALDISELTRYTPASVTSATADLTVTALAGQAPAGGIPIAQYQQFLTVSSPVKSFLAVNATSIPEGAFSTSVPVIQGIRVVDQVILASAAGDPNESIRFPVARTPHDHIEIKVDAVTYTVVQDFRDSLFNDRHCILKMDEDLYTTVTFGDGVYGTGLQAGSQVTATYIQSFGKEGNTPKDKIQKVVGSLAATVSVTNPEIASGGSDGDTVEDVVRKAPAQASSFFMAFNDRSFESLAETLVPGVFKALTEFGVGTFVNLYIMPEGGGIASSTLLNLVEETLSSRLVYQTHLTAKSLLSAHVLVDMRIVLKVNGINKTVVRKKIYESISAFKLDGKENTAGALYFKNLDIGRGFAQSDISSILESIDNGALVDYVDFLIFTRYPTPVPSNPLAPDFQGEILPLEPCDYDDWTIQATTTTQFYLFKNGVLDSTGTRGVQHTSSDGSIRFTLGTLSDTFTIGDNWTFSTSAFRDNMRLSKFEFMELARDNDLRITVYYPGEFEVGSM